MPTTIELPVSPQMLASQPATPGTQRKIVVVAPTEQHTLVIQSGAARRCLRFSETITGAELRTYCYDNFGWTGLESMQLVIDGQVFAADAAAEALLVPTVAKVGFEPAVPKTAEIRRVAPAKG